MFLYNCGAKWSGRVYKEAQICVTSFLNDLSKLKKKIWGRGRPVKLSFGWTRKCLHERGGGVRLVLMVPKHCSRDKKCSPSMHQVLPKRVQIGVVYFDQRTHAFAWSKTIKNIWKSWKKWKRYFFHDFWMFSIVFDHANAWASMRLLVKIHNR